MTVVFRDGYLVSAQEASRLAASIDGTYTFESGAGGAVTPSANMTVAVAAITGSGVVANGVRGSTNYAGGTVTHDAADATPRRDHIWFQVSDGTVGITKGTAATNPMVPDLTAGRISVAVVTIAVGDTVIGAGDIDDRRAAGLTGPFDAIRSLFRSATPRRLLGEYAAVQPAASFDDMSAVASGQVVGVGFTEYKNGIGIGPTLTNALLEAYSAYAAGGALSAAIGSLSSTSIIGNTAPNKNPRMLLRWIPGASHANLTTTVAGFGTHASAFSATMSGAYLRANTTGNLFFVTRQGGSETTTDLGARPTTPTSYEIYTEDAGVTWLCRNSTSGSIVATHTTNVPTATVAIGHVIAGISSGAATSLMNPVYCRVEGNSVP